MDRLFLELHISKFNFNGLMMQFEQFFYENRYHFLFSLSKTNVQQSYFKIYL